MKLSALDRAYQVGCNTRKAVDMAVELLVLQCQEGLLRDDAWMSLDVATKKQQLENVEKACYEAAYKGFNTKPPANTGCSYDMELIDDPMDNNERN